MDDKELLQKIKNVRTAVKEIYGNVNTITYPIYMVDWLIEQAEKIQRCQESYSGLNKMYDHWRNKAKELEKQLQQAQAKVNELEQSLNDAAETAEQFLNDKHFYMDELKKAEAKIEQYERARQSYLQACDELEAHANEPDIVLSIVSELRQALEG